VFKYQNPSGDYTVISASYLQKVNTVKAVCLI